MSTEELILLLLMIVMLLMQLNLKVINLHKTCKRVIKESMAIIHLEEDTRLYLVQFVKESKSPNLIRIGEYGNYIRFFN
jgi:hypothetical protein